MRFLSPADLSDSIFAQGLFFTQVCHEHCFVNFVFCVMPLHVRSGYLFWLLFLSSQSWTRLKCLFVAIIYSRFFYFLRSYIFIWLSMDLYVIFNGNPAVSRSLWYLNVIRYIFARVGCGCCNFGSTTFSDCWLFWWFLVISKLWPSLGQAFTVR